MKRYFSNLDTLKQSASRWPINLHLDKIVRKMVGYDVAKLETYIAHLDDLYYKLDAMNAFFSEGPKSQVVGEQQTYTYEFGLLEGYPLPIREWLVQIDSIERSGKGYEVLFQPGRIIGSTHYSGWPDMYNADSWETIDSRIEFNVRILPVELES